MSDNEEYGPDWLTVVRRTRQGERAMMTRDGGEEDMSGRLTTRRRIVWVVDDDEEDVPGWTSDKDPIWRQ